MQEYQNTGAFWLKDIGYTPNWSEVFVISKIKNIVPWTYVINDLNGEELLELFMKKNCKQLIKKNLG